MTVAQPDWDQRYSGSEFAYGTEANSFLAEHVDLLNSPVLSIAEGEGRNAVFVASHRLNVHGVDGSQIGLTKAQTLAAQMGVNITTEVADLNVYEPGENTYGSIISIFAHLPSVTRKRLCPLLEYALQAGGILLLEAYSEDQLGRGTGGPPDPDMLMTPAKIEAEFPACEPILLRTIERDVYEGKYHTGLASVVQFIGRKRL